MSTSEYFKSMFSIDMIEATMDEIRLEEPLLKPFQLVLKIAYGCHITEEEWNGISFVDIFEAIVMANKYQFTEIEIIISNVFLNKLKDNSHDFITEEINYRLGDDKSKKKEKFLSVLEVHELAKSYQWIYFTEISRLYMQKKAQEVMDSWKLLYNYWW